jgi:hypothetical protein
VLLPDCSGPGSRSTTGITRSSAAFLLDHLKRQERTLMHEHDTNHIRLPVFDEDGTQVQDERLLVQQHCDSQFRLEHSPGFVEGLAAGDVIELDPNTWLGFRILERGGNLCVWFYFPEIGQNKAPMADRLRQEIEGIGGWLDGGAAYMLVFTIPVAVGFTRVEELFNSAVALIPGSEWLYGNVYDPLDRQTPMNWWHDH